MIEQYGKLREKYLFSLLSIGFLRDIIIPSPYILFNGACITDGNDMVKKEMISEDEKKVLDELEKNGKESIDDIAKRCGFSRQKVWRIIKSFEEDKTIWGYIGVENNEIKGLSHFILLVKRSTTPIESDKKRSIPGLLDPLLPEDVRIQSIYLTHGFYDGVVTFYAPNLVTAKKLIQNISKNLDKIFTEFLLLETLIPIRKSGLKNPHLDQLSDLL
jgi:DNA-binding Lrp family transcriptional regulator